MGKLYETIEPALREFIQAQRVFFVATAPLEPDGLVNLSPKGLQSSIVLDERTFAYADLTGSGIETVAHLKQNSRIVVMFCAFDGPPRILRLHGQGEVLEADHPEFESLQQRLIQSGFQNSLGLRCIIRVHCTRISTSCGFGVPLMEFREHREQLPNSYQRRGANKVQQYQQENNLKSLDGLAGLGQRPNA